MSGAIFTKDVTDLIPGDPNGASNAYGDITGQTLGTKRAIHTFSAGGLNQILEMCQLLINGTIPEVNFDRIKMTTVTTTSILLDFLYNGSIQFSMSVTNAYSDFDISLVSTNSIGLESGVDLFSLESGDELLLEGA